MAKHLDNTKTQQEVKQIIFNDNTLVRHFQAYDLDKEEYVEQLTKMYSNKQLAKNVTNQNKTKALIVIIHRLDKTTFREIIDDIDLPELTRACVILDSSRKVRQLKRKIEKSSSQRAKKRHKKEMETLTQLSEGIELSFTLSKVKLVKEWVRNLTPEQLVYRALLFPVDNWRQLADLTHLHSKHDFSIDWFLPYCYGEKAPENTIVAKFQNMTLDNFLEINEEYNLSYKLFRVKFADQLKNPWGSSASASGKLNRIKEHFARNEKLKVCLWWWDELHTTNVDSILAQRLSTIENIDLSYGKLVNLLMKVKNQSLFEELVRIAQNRLNGFETTLETPIAVLGDASSSMQVAINTSSIITSLLCSLTKAELHIFKTQDIPVHNPPNTVREAINFAQSINASNSTSPASSLWAYYAAKKAMKTFIIVTDEEENTSSSGYTSWYGQAPAGRDRGFFFAELYQKYCKEVYPAKLVFISFSAQNVDAFMVKELKNLLGESRFSEFVQVFKFNTRNPDLNRLDFVLEQMSTPLANFIDNNVENSSEMKVVSL